MVSNIQFSIFPSNHYQVAITGNNLGGLARPPSTWRSEILASEEGLTKQDMIKRKCQIKSQTDIKLSFNIHIRGIHSVYSDATPSMEQLVPHLR
jgi:hypothetical protein